MNLQNPSDNLDYLYRNSIGIMVINKDKKIFVGKRIDNHSDAWQMPQGGLDAGEDEDTAMHRELKEETGITSNIEVLAISKKYYYYNLPYRLQKKFWGGKYLGQKQKWYLVKYLGEDKDVNISNENPEFSEWKWIFKEELVKVIVSFKRKLYVDVIKEFGDYLK